MAHRPKFRIETLTRGTSTTIVVAGELVGTSVAALSAELDRAFATPGLGRLILDLEQTSAIDAAGLEAIVALERLAQTQRLPLTVRPAPTDEPTLGERLERIEFELPVDPSAPGRARMEVRQAFDRRCSDDEIATALLLTSELVTNAVVHPRLAGHSRIGLRVIAFSDGLRVEVRDGGAGFEPGATPTAPERGGRGLMLVDRLASRWGTAPTGQREQPFCVWFELATAPPRQPVAAVVC